MAGQLFTVIFSGGPINGLRLERSTLPEEISVPVTSHSGALAMTKYVKCAQVMKGEPVRYVFQYGAE